MGDHLGTPGAVDFLANPQLPSVASMANPLGGPGRGSSLGSETHPAFITNNLLYGFIYKKNIWVGEFFQLLEELKTGVGGYCLRVSQ